MTAGLLPADNTQGAMQAVESQVVDVVTHASLTRNPFKSTAPQRRPTG
jgi:hypothetical protein